MTLKQLTAIVFRRWYVAAVVLLLAFAGMWMARHAQGVYDVQVDVMFTSPQQTLAAQTTTVTYFAAAVEREYNNGVDSPRVASPTATLYGQGIYSGSSVELIDLGGQWATNFNQPTLGVEVVDSSPQRVQAELNNVLAKINNITAKLQAAQRVEKINYISTSLSPNPPVVVYETVNRTRAMAGIAVMGLALAGVLPVLTDRLFARLHTRKS